MREACAKPGACVAVEHDAVMAPEFEFESLEGWYSLVDVGGLANEAKGQHEDRKLRIDGTKAVVAALIGISDVVAEFHAVLFQKTRHFGSRWLGAAVTIGL